MVSINENNVEVHVAKLIDASHVHVKILLLLLIRTPETPIKASFSVIATDNARNFESHQY